MQKERLVKFDFDFNKVYKELKRKSKPDFLKVSSYYYLTWDDCYHDILAKAMNYIESEEYTEDTINEDTFKKIYWTTAKYLRMSSLSRWKKNDEFKNFIQISTIEPDDMEEEARGGNDLRALRREAVTEQRDLDSVLLMQVVDKKFPTIQRVLKGYSFKEGGVEQGITERGYSKRFHKEVAQLKKIAHVQ